MQFVCEAPPKTWFRIETEGEATLESRAMNHAVEKYFKQAYEQAAKTYVPPKTRSYIEQNIGLKAHIQRAMPRFLTLRDGEGNALVTAMLPPDGPGRAGLQADHRRLRQQRSLPGARRGHPQARPSTSASRSIRCAAIPIGAAEPRAPRRARQDASQTIGQSIGTTLTCGFSSSTRTPARI